MLAGATMAPTGTPGGWPDLETHEGGGARDVVTSFAVTENNAGLPSSSLYIACKVTDLYFDAPSPCECRQLYFQYLHIAF